jgi:hypothetical protein
VFLNGSDAPVTVPLADRPFVTPDGASVREYSIPPKSGMLFLAYD